MLYNDSITDVYAYVLEKNPHPGFTGNCPRLKFTVDYKVGYPLH